MNISLTEENYIKAIYAISTASAGKGASTNALSAQLNNKAASVTDMLKRLSEKKLIHYRKYHNVTLTGRGQKLALDIVRRHRLWEVFLTQKLHFGWEEVHEIAEQLEHVKSEELIHRLDAFLGNPRFDPHGDPIPDASGHVKDDGAQPLSSFDVCGRYIFRGVAEHSTPFLKHLSTLGLKIGDPITVREINTFDRSMTVSLHRRPHFFSEKITDNLLVVPAK